MATELQKDLAKAIIANAKLPRHKRKNKGELVKSVGYSEKSAAVRSTVIIEAKGVKDIVRAAGLTEDFIAKALKEDIESKVANRAPEMRLGAEILGMKQEEKQPGINVFMQVGGMRIINDDTSTN